MTDVSAASCALLVVPDNECHPSYDLRWWLSMLTFLIKVHLQYLRYDTMRSIRHQKWKNVDLLLAQNIKKLVLKLVLSCLPKAVSVALGCWRPKKNGKLININIIFFQLEFSSHSTPTLLFYFCRKNIFHLYFLHHLILINIQQDLRNTYYNKNQMGGHYFTFY